MKGWDAEAGKFIVEVEGESVPLRLPRKNLALVRGEGSEAEAPAAQEAAPDPSRAAPSKGGGKGKDSAWEVFVHKNQGLTDEEREFLWESKHRACWAYAGDGRCRWGDRCKFNHLTYKGILDHLGVHKDACEFEEADGMEEEERKRRMKLRKQRKRATNNRARGHHG